jgi:YVTN family beta-propeller protein
MRARFRHSSESKRNLNCEASSMHKSVWFERKLFSALIGCSTLCCFASLSVAAAAPGYKVTKQYPVPGNGGFDYIVFDGTADRLYVSHGTEVDVVDAASGKVVGKIEDTPGVHGIAVVPKLHRGFTTNGRDSTVSVFDTKTLETTKKIPVGKDPDFTFYDPKTNRVFVCHGDGAVITAIDPATATVVGKVDLGGGAEAAVVDGNGNGYVNLEESAEVVHFDPDKLTVKAKWPITGCKTPTGLAIDESTSRLFIGCRSKVLAVMNANTGKVITTLPIGDRVDAVAFDPEKHLIFASNGGGTVSVIKQNSADSYTSEGDIQTQPSAKTMALDQKSGRLFLSAAEMEEAPAQNGQRSRMTPKPNSFHVIVVERQ